ncbi:MT-A70 family protein, partial [Reticulomyxa filosa]
ELDIHKSLEDCTRKKRQLTDDDGMKEGTTKAGSRQKRKGPNKNAFEIMCAKHKNVETDGHLTSEEGSVNDENTNRNNSNIHDDNNNDIDNDGNNENENDDNANNNNSNTKSLKKNSKSTWTCPPHSVPIRADVMHFDFKALANEQLRISGRLFDVIMMDPPWQLASSNPTRGVAIGYEQLTDESILALPIPKLQSDGFLLVWTINAKYRLALQMFKKWGYRIVNDIAWVKQTVNRRIARGHGFYLQHAKETCLVGFKGEEKKVGFVSGVCADVIYSVRRGQSQKPVEIYEYIERLVPNGCYLEIFGRRNNLRDYWVTIGNEL